VENVKNGVVGGRQRYRCRGCGFNFTREEGHGKSAAVKDMAVALHLCGMTLSSIGDILGVTAQSVMRWVRAKGEATPAPWLLGAQLTTRRVELDEMHSYLLKKTRNCGSGRCWIMEPANSSAGPLAIVLWPRDKSS
jgi:transposase